MSASRRKPSSRGSGLGLTRRQAALAGERIELRPPSDADREALAGLLDGPSGEVAAIVRREDGRPVGALAYRLANGWLVVEAVALEAGERGRGYGSEAVRLIEEDAGKRGAKRFGFAVPQEDGLALYFALRLGYRPAAAGERLWHGASGSGIIAVVRTPGVEIEPHDPCKRAPRSGWRRSASRRARSLRRRLHAGA